jgi:hypothetical protein
MQATTTAERVAARIRGVLRDYDAVTERLAAADRAADFATWSVFHRGHTEYLEILIDLESALGLAGEYELAAEVAERLLRAWPEAPSYIAANLAAYRAAVDVERRWLDRVDIWPDAADAGRVSRRALGGLWASVHAFEKAPYWDGRPLGGQALLVRHSHGYGDWLLRARHFRTLVGRFDARVIAEVHPSLERLAASTPFVERAVARHWPADGGWLDDRRDYALVTYKAWVSSHDLPVFVDARPDDPPVLPYLAAEPRLVEQWRRRLGPRDARLRVGLVWSADPSHPWGRTRSMRLAEFAPLAQVPGVQFYALQKTGSIQKDWTRPADGGPEEEAAPPGLELTRLSGEFEDFADTAAVLSSLDLLISVDTSVANLAGGLGLPFWVPLPAGAPAALWGTVPDRCAAYPTARLFRQTRPGAWGPVVGRVADALRRLVAERCAA